MEPTSTLVRDLRPLLTLFAPSSSVFIKSGFDPSRSHAGFSVAIGELPGDRTRLRVDEARLVPLVVLPAALTDRLIEEREVRGGRRKGETGGRVGDATASW